VHSTEKTGHDFTGMSTCAGYDVVRQDATGKKSIVGHSLVSDIAFTYSPAPPKTRVVSVDMTYDAMPGRYAKLRKATFETRLRNVQ
jgi:hypothetical protein